MIPSHVVSWGIPIISFIVVLAKDKLTGSPLTLMTCAIDGNATGYFWGCLLVGLFVSIGLTLTASIFLLKTLFRVCFSLPFLLVFSPLLFQLITDAFLAPREKSSVVKEPLVVHFHWNLFSSHHCCVLCCLLRLC
jgi:hypothetical protein